VRPKTRSLLDHVRPVPVGEPVEDSRACEAALRSRASATDSNPSGTNTLVRVVDDLAGDDESPLMK
jgi:hypothetical protein